MSYREALEAAGAIVVAFEIFGSYQCDWWARVRYGGNVGWVTGSFGSCTVCDAFEAEFPWLDPTEEQLAKFGQKYLDHVMTDAEALKEAGASLAWDVDAEAMVNFILTYSGKRLFRPDKFRDIT